MNILDLTPQHLKRAASIKGQIDALNKQLRHLLERSTANGATPRKKRTMSAAVKKKIAAAQKARWTRAKRGWDVVGEPGRILRSEVSPGAES